MNVPTEFLRGVIGLLGVACAYMAGRNLSAVRQGRLKPSSFFGWAIRTLLCLAALAFRHPVDPVEMIVWALTVTAFSFALFGAHHQKPRQEPPPSILPDE